MAANTMKFAARRLRGFLCRGLAFHSLGSFPVAYPTGAQSNNVVIRGFCGSLLQNQKLYFHPRKQLISPRLLHGAASSVLTCSFSTLVNRVCPNTLLKSSPSVKGVRFLPTLNQIRRSKPRTKNSQPKKYVPRAERILLGPQRKGVCVKVFVRKPKKPNSAQRKCALLRLSSGKTITAYIPGQKGQLQEHGVVLFEGGRVQDCPGIQYKIIRGKLDMN